MADPPKFHYEDQEYYIRGIAKNKSGTIVTVTEVKYYVRMTNPCIRTSPDMPIKAATIAQFEVWVKDPKVTRSVNYFKD